MEDRLRWLLVAAFAPVVWGSTYYVTRHALPADVPLWGAVIRALPAGLLLLLLARRLPSGSWWWRSVVLGTLNTGAFFVLVYAAGQLLPSSIAAMIMSLSPIVMMLFAWLLIAERPTGAMVLGGLVGVAGVVLLLGGAGGGLDPWGVVASVAAMAMSGLGFVLTKKWGRGGDLVATTAWQLVAGGLTVVPVAVLVEGAPPRLDATALAGFAYLTLVGTALAYVAWFAALAHLPAGSVGLVGLLNPVTGTLLGLALAGEVLTGIQALGIAVVLAGLLLGQLRPRPHSSHPSSQVSHGPPGNRYAPARSDVGHQAAMTDCRR